MPVERWTTARVEALAPDPASLRNARGVTGHISDTGLAGEILWGLCRGYQVAVDLAGPAFKCSCPSRKIPCKHALGLLLHWCSSTSVLSAVAASDSSTSGSSASDPSDPSASGFFASDLPGSGSAGSGLAGSGLAGSGSAGWDPGSAAASSPDSGSGSPPDFVTDWQRARAARAKAKVAPPDPVAAAKRAQGRAERVAGGMAELRRWLDDQIEQGLAAASRSGPQMFEAMAARLIDAQAPGAAGTVRRLAGIAGVGPHWADRLLGEMALLRLLVAGHSRLDQLHPALAATVRSRIGFPTSTEEVLAGPRLTDRWQVLGQVETDDGTLTTRRTWLRGATSGRFALILTFAAPGQPLTADLLPGTEFRGDLCFYPAATPLRALVAERVSAVEPLGSPDGACTVRAALAQWSGLLAAEPWRFEAPMLLADVTPTADGFLVDAEGSALPLAPGHRKPWWLLAAAGATPATVAAEWSPAGLRPLAAWADGSFVPTAPPAPDPSARREAELPPELLTAALVGTGRRPWSGRTLRTGTLTVDIGAPARSTPPAPTSQPSTGTVPDRPASASAPSISATSAESSATDLPLDGTSATSPASVGVPSVGAGAEDAGAEAAGAEDAGAEAAGAEDAGAEAAGAEAAGAEDAGAEAAEERGGGSRAGELLEAAAVALICRRAGLAAAAGHVPLAAAPVETAPRLPAAASARLALVLGGGAPGGGHHEQGLLAQWLSAAAARERVVAPVVLPDLLEAGRRNISIRADLARVVGRRGRWLAGQRGDWRWLLSEAPPTLATVGPISPNGPLSPNGPKGPDPTSPKGPNSPVAISTKVPIGTNDPNGPSGATTEPATGGTGDWATGSSAERLGLLAALRATDPGRARELLESTWAEESSETRVRFLAALATGLSLDDEPLLERSLDDRRKEVRGAALDLLHQLPGSGLSRRMAARAAAAVRLDDSGRLTVEPPTELDRDLQRDGVGAAPVRGIGAGAWLLEEVLAGTPLDHWAALDPDRWLASARGHDWADPLVHGWAKAAALQRDARWASALLGDGAVAATLREAVRWDLHLALPPDRLARLAAEALRSEDGSAQRLLSLHPGPWPDGLSVAVLETVEQRARTDRHTWQLGELCRAAGLAMPPGYADLAGRLAVGLDRTVDPSRVRPVTELARTLTFRHEMLQELQ